jgi:mono/diheme cytochrome c family protein
MISRFSGQKRIKVLGSLIFTLVITQPNPGWAQEPGEALYQKMCAACHTIGDGRRVGPDLENVQDRRSPEWLEKFVTASKSMISSGDAEAVAVFEEYNRMPMPEIPISSEQVQQIFAYVKTRSSVATDSSDGDAVEEASPVAAEQITESTSAEDQGTSEEDVLMGQRLFQGTTRFLNNGPTCNACHDVKNDAVIGGGILAAELTTVFSRMGGAGVKAILGSQPFPVMQIAYKDKALTEDEITYLVAFLQSADEEQLFHQPRDYGIGLFISGLIGAGILFIFFGLLWRGRKKGSVNQAIYDRQIKSVSDDSVS